MQPSASSSTPYCILRGSSNSRAAGADLAWLVAGIEPGRRVKVRLLPVKWAEVCRDLERALEFDQSLMFRRIYEDEFGMPGGEPYGLMVIDHAVRHRVGPGAPTDDVGALTRLSAVAAAAFMPVVLSLDPNVLEVDRFADLEGVRDITAPLRGTDHMRWRSLAGRADMRFVAITFPRLLARHPWTDDPSRVDGFRYSEYTPDTASRVWMSAGYALAPPARCAPSPTTTGRPTFAAWGGGGHR